MSHEHGSYLGGVKCIETLRDRCRVDPHTDCWHWSLSVCQGTPMVWLHLGGGRRVKMRGRRAALFLARGTDLPAGHLAYARKSCNSSDCVNPAHCMSGSKAQWGSDMAARGEFKNIPSRIRASRETGARMRALTDDQAHEVRHSNLTLRELAQKFGVSVSLVGEVRRGVRYREVANGASVFAWRGVL